jgi:hypothetical protein
MFVHTMANVDIQGGIRLMLKPMQLAYALEVVLAQVPTLQHGTDGLIYTAVNSQYIPQTDEGM